MTLTFHTSLECQKQNIRQLLKENILYAWLIQLPTAQARKNKTYVVVGSQLLDAAYCTPFGWFWGVRDRCICACFDLEMNRKRLVAMEVVNEGMPMKSIEIFHESGSDNIN